MPGPSVTIEAASSADLPDVERLAGIVWRRHYPQIIGSAQTEYMLARGYSPSALVQFLAAPGAGIAFSRDGAVRAGFAAWYLPGERGAVKLDKLYVLQEHHGRGLGRMLIEHVAAAGRAAGCDRVILNVNKHNFGAIRAYERCGFSVRESVVVDIGGGFVMDDFVMARKL